VPGSGSCPGARDANPASPDWSWSGIGDEVEAFLHGRYADHLAERGRAVPAWAAINRLAHTDHRGLVALVAGSGVEPRHALGRRHAWAEEERFVAASLLARSGATPAGLHRMQREALVPVELSLIGRSAAAPVSMHDALGAATAALDHHTSGA
jgi:hypothetical protein